jgi:DNA-binding NtrC family response regulator
VPIVPPVVEQQQMTNLQHHAFFGEGYHAAVLDDDPGTRNATAGLLRSWGFEVREAASPAELDSVPVDLLVADGDGAAAGDGIAAVLTMRDERPGLRIVLLTEEMETLPPGETSSAIDMLRKPVPPIVLRAAVTKAMSGPAGQ